MHPSRSYTYDDQPPQISAYNRSLQTSSNRPAHAQSLNRPSYEELRASYLAQQQLRSNNPTTGLDPREGAAYVPLHTPPPPNQYLTPAQYNDGQPHGAGYKQSSDNRLPYPGYMYEQAYPGSSQFPASNPFPVPNQDVNRRGFVPTPSEMVHVYPNYSGSSRPVLPSQQHPFDADPRHMSRSSQSHSSSLSTTVPHVPGHVQNVGALLATERYPCEKCGKTFSRCVR
jgi:hypothetical protein